MASTDSVNGVSPLKKATLNGILNPCADDEQAIRDIRKLIIDCCRQNGGGHGGSAIGMVPLAVALWKRTIRYNALDANWFDRDRFVLSNGHAAILLYTMLHVAGYPHMSMDELKLYASAKMPDPISKKWKATICHGHPEIEIPGVEVTTGPLGQGIANAVGLAIASKQHAALFNRPGYTLVSSRIFCTTGDGCLQEGVAQEALAIAGHLGLDNLLVCYDNNQVTCDGPLDWIVSEDTNAKMRSLGWNVIDVLDGDQSVNAITAALDLACTHKNQPTFINIRTTIGYGTSSAGTFKAHHGTYSDDDAALYADRDITTTHTISGRTKAYFAPIIEKGKKLQNEWQLLFAGYQKGYPKEAEELERRIGGKLDVVDFLNSIEVPAEIQATRQWNGAVFNQLMERVPNLLAGGADLWNSNQMGDQSYRIFSRNHHDGRVIRYGIREHAMASISNGIAAYGPGAIIPVTATFFMFYLYAAPGVRMGALSGLQVIHVATHDSIGEGQNGPTHQPVELDSLYRAMPNLQYIRPSTSEEVVGAWLLALQARDRPSIISVARDPATFEIPGTNRQSVQKGGYTILEVDNPVVTLISCGSELQFGYLAALKLASEAGIPTRVVSMPCISVFEQQSVEYQDGVLSLSPHVISIEAYVSSMWARFCTASIAMDSYGYSGSGIANFTRFGFDVDSIVNKVKRHVQYDIRKGRRRWTLLK
jgi:dihydroxyacetone synthase